MIDTTSIMLFIPTFFIVSISPGMCMILALTMGMTVGLSKTLWMMAGELLGVAVVGMCAVLGVATVMLQHPTIFVLFKYLGGGYLLYLGIKMWLSSGQLALDNQDSLLSKTAFQIAAQGFVTAVANPKGWAFMVSILPPFIAPDLPLLPQLSVMLLIVLSIEFMSLMIYANGGQHLRKLLQGRNNVCLINKISGTLMMVLGIWLALS